MKFSRYRKLNVVVLLLTLPVLLTAHERKGIISNIVTIIPVRPALASDRIEVPGCSPSSSSSSYAEKEDFFPKESVSNMVRKSTIQRNLQQPISELRKKRLLTNQNQINIYYKIYRDWCFRSNKAAFVIENTCSPSKSLEQRYSVRFHSHRSRCDSRILTYTLRQEQERYERLCRSQSIALSSSTVRKAVTISSPLLTSKIKRNNHTDSNISNISLGTENFNEDSYDELQYDFSSESMPEFSTTITSKIDNSSCSPKPTTSFQIMSSIFGSSFERSVKDIIDLCLSLQANLGVATASVNSFDSLELTNIGSTVSTSGSSATEKVTNDTYIAMESTNSIETTTTTATVDYDNIVQKSLNALLLLSCLTFTLYAMYDVSFGGAGSDITRGWTQSEIAMRIPIDTWSSYESNLQERPIYTKTVINVVIYLLGDWLSQTAFAKKNLLDFDPIRTVKNGFIGLCFGPLVHLYYQFSDTILPLDGGSGISLDILGANNNRLLKIVMDQTIYLSVKCSIYIVAVGLLNGSNWDTCVTNVRTKLKPICFTAWKFWPLVHLITYNFIPARHRILWVNCVDLIWNAILATKTSPPMPSPPTIVPQAGLSQSEFSSLSDKIPSPSSHLERFEPNTSNSFDELSLESSIITTTLVTNFESTQRHDSL